MRFLEVARSFRRILGVLLLLALPVLVRAEVVEWLPADSPFYTELDRLQMEGLIDTTVSLDALPMARVDLARLVWHARRRHPDRLDHPGIVRLSREFSREFVELGLPPVDRYTSPLVDVPKPREGESPSEAYSQGRFRLIPYLVVGYEEPFRGEGRFVDRSRGGLRMGLEAGRFLFYSDLYLGRYVGAQQFADPIIAGEDLIVYTENTYVSFRTGVLDASFGRNRLGLGPGRNGNLVWSSTADPMTNLRWGLALFGGKVRGTFSHADVNPSQNERLAAHRLEYTPFPSLSVGAHEAARYSSPHWEPLYVLGLIPYTFVQRMQDQDKIDDPGGSTRNNILLGLDAKWRIVPGTTVYGEFLLDNTNLEESGDPSRIGWQFGWLGKAELFSRRLTWRAEFDRVYRFVYTVFYGEDFVYHGMPIGYPLGPDSRNLFADFQYDLSSNWSVRLGGMQTEQGEGGLDEFYDPNGPPQSGRDFKGIVSNARVVRAGVLWTPRDGVAVTADGAYGWLENADHQDGVDENDWSGRFSIRLRH